MELTRSELGLALLVLTVLANCARAADSLGARGDLHSLRYELNITSNNQPRCMGQGQMDGMVLLLCDCDNNEVKHVTDMLKGTDILEDMRQKLKDTGDLVRGKLPDITPENYTKRDSGILQVKLMYQCDASGSCNDSLELGFDGESFLVFDSENGEYKADNSRGKSMKEKLRKIEELTKYFKVFLKGDCKKWLQFLVNRKKELETTAAAATATAPASPPTVPATPPTATTTVPAPSQAMNNIITWIIPIFIIPFVILCCICIQRRCRSGAPESGSSSTRVRSGRPPLDHPQVLTSDPLELQPLSAANGETSRRL